MKNVLDKIKAKMYSQDFQNALKYSLMKRKVIRYVAENLSSALRNLTPQEIDEAAIKDKNIVEFIENMIFQRYAEHVIRDYAIQAANFRKLISPDDLDLLLRRIKENLPEHGAVLKKHKPWCKKQVVMFLQKFDSYLRKIYGNQNN